MKKMDIFCASQASTAICMSMDQPSSSSSSSAIQLGGRAIDRYNPIIRDQRRIPRALPLAAPCTSQPPPINPTPYHLLPKTKKISSKNKDSSDQSSSNKKNSTKPKPKPNDQKNKKSSAKPIDIDDGKKITFSNILAKDTARRSWAKPRDFITPPGSSRYLLGDMAFSDESSDYDPVLAQRVPFDQSNRTTQANLTIKDYDPVLAQLVPFDQSNGTTQANLSIKDEPTASKPSSSSNSNQVVVLRVSLHCRGCEGKVRKHLSRMEGVTSFNIDFAAKKVTIVGDVTPSSVLESVSKVKNAQFWTSANPTAGGSNHTQEVKK